MAENKHRGSTLDELLAKEGVFEELQGLVVKEFTAEKRGKSRR